VQYNIAAQLKATTIQATIPVYQKSVSSISFLYCRACRRA
jgi:hypothetical protein